MVLDEHLVKAQTIAANPAVKVMEHRAIEWQ